MRLSSFAILGAALGCGHDGRTTAASELPSSAASIAAASHEPSAAPVTPAPSPPIHVLVEELPAEDAWRVTWTFQAPTPGLIFDRRRPAFRAGSWQPGPGLKWVKQAEHELLKTQDGSAAPSFSATFRSDDGDKERAPPLNVRFTDGTRLLFTAHLGAHAIECKAERCERRGLGDARHWTFKTSPDRSLRVLDETAQGSLAWAEPKGDLRGTYVVAGQPKAKLTDSATLLVDAGLPPWLAQRTEQQLPELLELYASKTGLTLDFKPLVLLSRSRADEADSGFRGRTLPGLVQLEALGKAWSTESADLSRRWLEFLAHESFHFYNSQLARGTGETKDEWISEGSSMYVAGLALSHVGVLDADALAARYVKAANDCLLTLKGPLRSEQAEAAFYPCGELVQLAADKALAPSGGIFPFYRALFEDARERGSFGTKHFVALLSERAKDPKLLSDLDALLEVGLGADPQAIVERLLAKGGVKARRATIDVKGEPVEGFLRVK
ncbi:MAG: hypothetical protein IPM79_20540 [Polyangiaceae bacterium]|nr:hypothetical protein [Polyangiaceae bacterium]MBK8939943.1 hypothetical protein [Polyangiaceae bacterium]